MLACDGAVIDHMGLLSLSWNSNRFALQCFRTAEMHNYNYHRHMMLIKCTNAAICKIPVSHPRVVSIGENHRMTPQVVPLRYLPPILIDALLSQGKGCVILHQPDAENPPKELHDFSSTLRAFQIRG